MAPSFFSLFKRGKYFHSAKPISAEATHGLRAPGTVKEAERFSAAAVAFACEHDSGIRDHFWRTVCYFTNDPPLEKVTIEIEPEPWADLRIVNSTGKGRFVYIIEFKVHAPLIDTQNPSQDAFIASTGYGQMLAGFYEKPTTRCRFIIFAPAGKVKLGKLLTVSGVDVVLRSWESFANNFPRSPLAMDLAKSLGKLGIGAFPAQHMKNIKIDKTSNDIGKAIQALEEVRRRINWPPGINSTSYDVYQDGGISYLGVELRQASKVKFAAELLKATLPPDDNVVWYGFEAHETGDTDVTLYVYCGAREPQRTIASRLRDRLTGSRIDEQDPDGAYHCVKVTNCQQPLGDTDWFCSVLHELGLPIS